MPEFKVLYLAIVALVMIVAVEKYRMMPFLALVLATGLYGVLQGGDPPWTAKEFNTGFAQTVAAAGLAILAAAMVSRLAETSGAIAWWHRKLGKRVPLVGTAAIALLAGLGGTPIGALAILTPVLRAAGEARSRLGLAAAYAVNAAQGCLLPSPLPIAALAILGGDWRWGLALGIPVALAQWIVGVLLARRAPAHAAPSISDIQPSPRHGFGLAISCLVLIVLIIGQSLGQIPSEPFGGGTARENLLGLGRPMILLLAGLAVAAATMGGFTRQGFSDKGWVAEGAGNALGIFLAVAAAGGLQMVLHNNGMADIMAERVSELPPALGIVVPFLVALVSRGLQGSALTAAITAAGIMQPLVIPLGLDGEAGRALVAIAVASGAVAAPFLNDGYFWLAGHHAGLGPIRSLRWVTGGALLQGCAGLVVLAVLAAVLG